MSRKDCQKVFTKNTITETDQNKIRSECRKRVLQEPELRNRVRILTNDTFLSSSTCSIVQVKKKKNDVIPTKRKVEFKGEKSLLDSPKKLDKVVSKAGSLY